MSQQSTASKPSLSGVKIKARKRTVQAQAKHEPNGASALYHSLIFPWHRSRPDDFLLQSSEISSTST